ncbi:MAG TPA: hypothetical protein DIW24_08805, partial [Bacteroidetes bacterium]|nr:hypothetical protein [Bacteroidota bacterium]
MKFFYVLLCGLLFPLIVFTQPRFPEPGFVFDDTSLPRIDLTLSPDSLRMAETNVTSDKEYVAKFQFTRRGVVEQVENVGFRVRGNTSRNAQKKSWKISFNTFQKGRKWYGLEKLNLNGEHNDPSIIRAKLAWNLFRQFGVAASRANHVRVFINGAYYGLYLNVENIDEEFVQSRFGNNNGNLYKCLWPADLAWRGSDPNAYKFTSGGRRTYELETNNTADDYTDFRDLVRTITQTSDAAFPVEIQKVFNVDGFLKVLAMDVAIGGWDNYWWLKNNYYLYKNQDTGLFEWIPYDYDNTFGIDFVGQDWGNRNVNFWGNQSETRPLVTRLLKVDAFRYRYLFYLKQILNNLTKPGTLDPEINRLYSMNLDAALADPYRLLDWNWDITSFTKSYDQALGGHVKYGLKTYLTTRYNSATDQISFTNISPILRYPKQSASVLSPNMPLIVQVQVEDDQPNPTLTLLYRFNGGAEMALRMRDDGTGGDTIAGDGSYAITIPAMGQTGSLSWYIEADDGRLGVTTYPPGAPTQTKTVPVLASPIVLNEFMAENTKTIPDEVGQFEDWVELYYAGDFPFSLENYYLSDDPTRPDKWPIPTTQLGPQNRYLLIFADEDRTQGTYHANFKLSKSGEYLSLAKKDGSTFSIVDALTFGPQTADVSFGREPDGTGNWTLSNKPTPGKAYLTTSDHDEQPLAFTVSSAFPNPFSNAIYVPVTMHHAGQLKLTLYDVLGRMIHQTQTLRPAGYQILDLTPEIPNGVYLLEVRIDSRQHTPLRKVMRV